MDTIILDNVKPGSRVVVAMSGGVDSSVAAALMAKSGYDVVGITLQLYDHGQAVKKKGACCAGQDIHDARRVASHIGIPHYVLDYESLFRDQVIEDFADSYIRGETPIPCVRCNQTVKFKDLLLTAKKLQASCLVTGHYVKRLKGIDNAELHTADDLTRDQSYFLFATTQEQLDFVRFPLGDFKKTEIRDIAREIGLIVSDKPDSQDICFVPNGNYASIVNKIRPGALDSGDIVDLEGNVLGKHDGIINYTVGQRRGLGISSPKPLYVIKINPDKKQVIVGPQEALAEREIFISDVNWLISKKDLKQDEIISEIKIRSTRPAKKGKVIPLENNKAKIFLDEDEYGVSPGQACVFYQGTRVIGGGWITRKVA